MIHARLHAFGWLTVINEVLDPLDTGSRDVLGRFPNDGLHATQVVIQAVHGFLGKMVV